MSVNQDLFHDNLAADSFYKGSLEIASVAWNTESVTIGGVATDVEVPTITVQIKNQAGANFLPTGTALTLAYVVAEQVLQPDLNGATPGNTQWQALTNSTLSAATPPNPIPTRPNTVACVKTGASLCDATGLCTCKGDTATANQIERNVRKADFDPATSTAVLQLGMQLGGATTLGATGKSITFAANGTTELVSATSYTTPTANDRQVVMTAACNACHGKVSGHGRVDVQYCTTCHTTQAFRKNIAGTEWVSVNFSLMIHGIHAANQMSLTYNLAGIDPGFTYPQDVRHCETCHQGTQAQYATTMPGTQACIGCHGPNTRTSSRPGITTECLNNGMKFYPDAACSASPSHQDLGVVPSQACTGCHNDITAQNAHAIAGVTQPFASTTLVASDFSYEVVSVKNAKVGEKPTVRIKVNAPGTWGGKDNCNILENGYWTQTTGASTLNVKLGWTTGNYTNVGAPPATGQTNSNGQVMSTNVIATSTLPANATAVADVPCQFDVAVLQAIPTEATGKTLAVYVDGHPAIPADSTYAPKTRMGAPNTVVYCPLVTTAGAASTCKPALPASGAQAGTAAEVVTLASCNKCHWNLSLHGSNRQGSLDVCTTCHNTEATAFFSSPTDFISIDFKTMIHRIHNANYQIYSTRSGSVTSFDEVTYPQPGVAPSATVPSTKLIACAACHVTTKNATTGKSPYFEPRAAQNGTSTTRGATAADNLRTTKWFATCGSCHRGGDSIAHMQGFGGGAGMTQAEIDALNGIQDAPAIRAQ